jgi:hypothetical protein
MRPQFLADADFNQKIVTGLRRREPLLDFLSAEFWSPEFSSIFSADGFDRTAVFSAIAERKK